MFKLEYEEVKQLSIEFLDVEYGLLYFELELGEKCYKTNFSDVFDPLPSLKSWLEAIAVGVDQCSFWFDPEGNETKFNLEQISLEREVFTVSDYYDDSKRHLVDYVDRKQLVESFYKGILDFNETSPLIKEHWEVEYMWERLTTLLDADYPDILDPLAELGRDELGQVLFKACPSYTVSFPDAPEEKRFGYAIDHLLGKPTPEKYPLVETPDEWHVPEDFDLWENEKRRAFVKDCLSCPIEGGPKGTKISEFRSRILDAYLSPNVEIAAGVM